MKPSTPLPWEGGTVVCRKLNPDSNEFSDAAYIVHACNAYPRLMAEREELIGALRDLNAWCDQNIARPFPNGQSMSPSLTILQQRTRALLAKLEEHG